MYIPQLEAKSAKISELSEALKILADHQWAVMVGVAANDLMDSKAWYSAESVRAQVNYNINYAVTMVSYTTKPGEMPLGLNEKSDHLADALANLMLLMNVCKVDWEDVMAAVEHKLRELKQTAESTGPITRGEYMFKEHQFAGEKKLYITRETDHE